MSGRGLHLVIELADVPPIAVLAQFETLAPQVVGGEVLAQERVAFQLGEQDHDRPLGACRLELDQVVDRFARALVAEEEEIDDVEHGVMPGSGSPVAAAAGRSGAAGCAGTSASLRSESRVAFM